MPDKKIEELEVRVTSNWVDLIEYVRAEFPNGRLLIQVIDGQPTKLVGPPEPDIRFDKKRYIQKYAAVQGEQTRIQVKGESGYNS